MDRRTTLQMEIKGEKTVTMYSEDGDQFRARYQIADVTRPLSSTCRVCDRETMCCSRRLVAGSSIMRQVGTFGSLVNMECMCYTHDVLWVRWSGESFPRQECYGSAISRDSWSRRSLQDFA